MANSSVGAVTQGLSSLLTCFDEPNSVANFLRRMDGYAVTKTHTIDGNGAQVDNVFQVTGVVRLTRLYLAVTAVTNSTTFSGVKFTLYDGTLDPDIATAVDASGALVGAVVFKDGLVTDPLTFVRRNTCIVQEATKNAVLFTRCLLTQKSATNTYIRLKFTGAANTNLVAKITAHYWPMTSDGAIVAV